MFVQALIGSVLQDGSTTSGAVPHERVLEIILVIRHCNRSLRVAVVFQCISNAVAAQGGPEMNVVNASNRVLSFSHHVDITSMTICCVCRRTAECGH